jgi:hypothetical protein
MAHADGQAKYKPYLYPLTQCINTRNTLLSQIISPAYKKKELIEVTAK